MVRRAKSSAQRACRSSPCDIARAGVFYEIVILETRRARRGMLQRLVVARVGDNVAESCVVSWLREMALHTTHGPVGVMMLGVPAAPTISHQQCAVAGGSSGFVEVDRRASYSG